MMMMMMMMMMNCFCGMVDLRKALSFISSWDHCQRFSTSQISDTPRAGFEAAQNTSSDFVEGIFPVVITTTPWCVMITTTPSASKRSTTSRNHWFCNWFISNPKLTFKWRFFHLRYKTFLIYLKLWQKLFQNVATKIKTPSFQSDKVVFHTKSRYTTKVSKRCISNCASCLNMTVVLKMDFIKSTDHRPLAQRPIDPPNNDQPTHQPNSYRPTDKIMFKRLKNRKTFILQNANSWKWKTILRPIIYLNRIKVW